ncbi:hypothetical protein PIIN_11399 [Serendipita indica DSM 11827]|uniref:Uncharacterized protein n=1 Tax=Serendipita indica (strain DSM 11827) TaxID=1109443 RepID=G4U1H9_SERID|nr:hypothetical protein PIIN_11399 [Serendipita indica DSM 11827]
MSLSDLCVAIRGKGIGTDSLGQTFHHFAAIARTSALLAAQKEKPDAPPKKVRGKKKAQAA